MLETCPVDAIIGTHKRMHTVIESHCPAVLCFTGLPGRLHPHGNGYPGSHGLVGLEPADADKARARYAAHARRREPNTATAQTADQATTRTSKAQRH